MEYEDDRLAHIRSVRTLHPKEKKVELIHGDEPVRASVVRNQGMITLTLKGKLNDAATPGTRPCLRVWNRWETAGTKLADVSDQVAATYPIAGDRWYFPVEDGVIQAGKDERLPGHRVFRGIAKLQDTDGFPKVSDKRSDVNVLSQVKSVTTDLPSRVAMTPVAHRLDDSLHRLTGALNAAQALTRQTPCKELQTRVSYLPLRRWLASTFVHEIVDLDLESFMAKVRRSIDVAPEDEHRFREQAALILEEANELAGRIPSGRDASPRPQDIV